MELKAESPAPEPTEKIKKISKGKSHANKEGTIKQPKSYACLLTCAVTRAVHLEFTKTVSAHDFLLALGRFSAKRDNVSTIFSYNAQTFSCVFNHLKVLRCDLLAMRKTKWIFPPA